MKRSLRSILSVLAAFGAMVPAAHATTIYTITEASGATAEADFTFTTNSLTLVLKDTSVNPGDVTFNLSGFEFTFLGGTGGALTGASSLERTVASGGAYSDGAALTTAAAVGWTFSNSLNDYKIDVLGGGGAGPSHTIIGSPAADNQYDAANGSIAGNGPHNPFLALMAAYTFSFTGGVDSNTIPTAVSFQFGTVDGNFDPGTCQSGCSGTVPEPVSFLLGGSGLLVLGLLRRLRPRIG